MAKEKEDKRISTNRLTTGHTRIRRKDKPNGIGVKQVLTFLVASIFSDTGQERHVRHDDFLHKDILIHHYD